MSFDAEYQKLRKKRLEEEASGKTVADDIAPLFSSIATMDVPQPTTPSAPETLRVPYSSSQGMGAGMTIVPVGVGLNETDRRIASYLGMDAETYRHLRAKEASEDNWFKAGAFEDGYDFGDWAKTVIGTSKDVSYNASKGAAKMIEGVGDLAIYTAASVADFLDLDIADDIKKIGQKDLTKAWFDDGLAGQFGNAMDEYSLLDTKSDQISQALGQIALIWATGGAAGGGAAGTTATTVLTGTSSWGNGMSEAYEGGATDGEAWGYGALSGLVDAGTEMIFGGLGKSVNALGVSRGIGGLDDMFAKKVSSKISSRVLANAAEWGIKATGEGMEEVLAGLGDAVAKKLTYMSDEELSQLIEDEQLLDQFITSTITSGIAQSGDLVSSTAKGQDMVTGLTTNEEAVIDAEWKRLIEEATKDGKELSLKEKNALYQTAMNNFKKGYITIDAIGQAIGGKGYEDYQSSVKNESDLTEQRDALKVEFDELNGLVKNEMTGAQQDRLEALRQQIKDIDQKISEARTNTEDYNKTWQQATFELVKDTGLAESFFETARRRQDFTADVSKYKGKQAEIVQKAIDSGILNNTNAAHDMVDLVSRVAAEKGVDIDWLNNEKLEGSMFAKDGAYVNGYYSKADNTIGVNIQSKKAINSVVGHEITHVLEGTGELYNALQKAAFAYAKAKGDYDSRREALAKLYAAEDIDTELTADLVGDYLFSDEKFIANLSTKHRNLFQKLWDEIKYLWNVAKAGSKEKRQLERVKKAFEKAYREGGKVDAKTEAKGEVKTDAGTKFSVSEGKTITNEDYQRMEDHFGVTENYDVAGWLLPNGKMLDFSGKHWGGPSDEGRYVDHRDIDEVLNLGMSESGDYLGYMTMLSNGNVRLQQMGNHGGGIHIESLPSAEQMATLRGFFNHYRGDIVVDAYDADGRGYDMSYSRGTSATKILSDIKAFYENGEIPSKTSSIGQFRYSLSDSDGKQLSDAEKIAHNDAVVEHFGKTYKWGETGYLLLDGTQLDLSGKHDGAPGGYRTVDHRDITEALGYDYGDGSYNGSLVQFMSEGNIRIIPEMCGINLSVQPTKAQEKALAEYIWVSMGEVTLDIDDANGYTVASVEYPRRTPASKVLGDIRAWFENGTKPEAPVRYSLSSIASSFYGDENMSANDFMKQDYTQTQGYKDYVNQCVNNLKQWNPGLDEVSARREVKVEIEGIVRVALAAKQAGYDIYDDASKRNAKDSKNRLLFSSLEPNSDYFTSNDISTECDKRKNFADIYDAIVKKEEAMGVPQGKRFFDNVDNYFYLHKVLADKGLTQPCRECYVESMRKNLAPMANAFMRLVGETDPGNTANDQLYQQKGKNKGELKTNNAATREWVLEKLAEYDMTASDLTVEMLTTEDGLAQLKIQAPMIYEAFNSFYGQSKPKMPRKATPFRFGELTALLTDHNGKIKKSLVDKINSTGGFRLQSYSDFQVENYTDVLQVLFEAGTLGLNGHAYTKVPSFLDATEGTNLKRNISIFMYKDGNEWKLDRNDSFPYSLEEIYDIVKADKTGNTSIIAVSQNDDMSAWIMANDLVGYGIPFHKSGLKMGTVRDTDVKTEDGRVIKGYSGTKDHTKQQTEVWKSTTADHKALTKVKNGINIYEFWDFNNADGLSKNELIEKNVKAYIDACENAGYIPKFRDYVMNNGKVLNDVLKYAKEMGYASPDATIADISFEYKGYTIPYGYYKFLGDFGMFTPDGQAAPQKPLSLENYDFDKAVDFFADAESLKRNEILQQFANGTEREIYRNSDLTAEQLTEIIKQRRGEVADSVVNKQLSLSAEGETPKKYGNFNIMGEDVALVRDDIAPTQESIAPVQDAAPAETVADAPIADMPDEPNLADMHAEKADLEKRLMDAFKANDEATFFPLKERYDALDEQIKQMEAEQSKMESERINSFTDEDLPPEVEAPMAEADAVTVDNPFDGRDIKTVGETTVKAYMYENPEVKPFFQEEANVLLGELQRTEKPQTIYNGWRKYEMPFEAAEDIPEIYRTKRVTTEDIAYMRDTLKMSYKDIENGLNAIIKDNGAENIAAAKKIEFIINDRLMKGYNAEGVAVPPNQAYLDLLNEKQIKEYTEEARAKFFEAADEYAPPESFAPIAGTAKPTIAKPQTASENIAPIPTYETAKKSQIPGQRTMFAEGKTAQIVTNEPDAPTKPKNLIAKARTHFLDQYSHVEDLSLETGNRELMAKADAMNRAESMAQYFIGHGDGKARAIKDIWKDIKKSGYYDEFQSYMYHALNVDRMSLESRAKAKIQSLQGKFGHLKPEQIHAIAATEITDKTTERTAQTIKEARDYLRVKGWTNVPVFSDSVTAEVSQQIVDGFEAKHPEFKAWAQEIYANNDYMKNVLVEHGVISQEMADYFHEKFPHYVPVRRLGKDGNAINVPLDSRKTGVNTPIKRATGGNSDIGDMFKTMAMRAEQTYRAAMRNDFGVELMHTLEASGETQAATANESLDEMLDGFEQRGELVQEGKDGKKPTFAVFENGKRVDFEITENLYEDLKPSAEWTKAKIPVVHKVSLGMRKLLTEWNPAFTLTNAVKDVQDIITNSQHPAATYANLPAAFKELITYAITGKEGKYLAEYNSHGGEGLTYFDGQKQAFTKDSNLFVKILGAPVRGISAVNNFIEKLPRLAEFIASRKKGASAEVAMLDAARVTTNFAAGGDVAKFANRNGVNFLNASIQGFNQQVRNFREAKARGVKGWLHLAAKFAAAGLPAVLLNHLIWGDDEEYEELADYVKDDYYIVAKTDDGKFIRIPKGRAVAVIQDAFEQVGNMLTGDDEVDLENFLELAFNNLAPNNPLENNILAPIFDVANNETWYGEDLVPQRLQDLPDAEQYDESTDSLSKWLGETFDISPYKINYLLNQYSGGVGDVFLPMMTPEAESGDNSFGGNLIAPIKDKFTTDSVMNNQNVSDFYDTVDELAKNANSMHATDKDVLSYKYMNAINAELGELYAQKREIQNSNLPDATKYRRVKAIQEQINALARESLASYGNVKIDGKYATVGDLHYRWYEPGEDSTAEPGWQKISGKQLEKMENVTSGLGISAGEYWSNKEEYDYAYDSPGKYAVAKSVGGYKSFRTYSSELYDIKADKDEDGKSISGSRKQKVIDYVNSLDIDYGMRIILFKSEYNADDTYNYDILEYLNSRDDLTYEERVAILKELGFTISADGTTASW